jgi:hypothetical protein
LSICQRRTPIAVPPASGCHIALRARKMVSGLDATGPQLVRIVRSNPSARRDQSGGFRGGSMSICSKLCSSALMQTQNAAKGSRRDGPIGAGLQSDTRHEHRRGQAVDRCDRGLRPTQLQASRINIAKAVFTRPRPTTDNASYAAVSVL